MKEIVSKTYCPLPFNHLYVHPTNMASVCCVFRKGGEDGEKENLPNIKEYKNLGDHLNHPFIKDIQQKMLKGEKVPGCATCYHAEEHGYQSFREKEIETWHIETFRDFTPPDLENPKLQFMEMTFGNYCNLACRTCHSDLSHSWIKDENELKKRGFMGIIHGADTVAIGPLKFIVKIVKPLGGKWDVTKFEMKNDIGKWIDCGIVSIVGQIIKSNGLPNHSLSSEVRVTLNDNTKVERINIEKEWHPDDFKDLQYIKITGGEPMLHPDFPKFMEQLEQKNVHCFIFTNASWVPKKRIFDLMKNFKYLSVFMSVDGTGDVQEYMRHNAKWDITEKSVRTWMEWSTTVNNVQISWGPTWSLMNAPYFVETCNWWLGLTEEILKPQKMQWNLLKTNFVFGPSIYQMSLLPTDTKEKLKIQALEYIEELKNKDIAGKEHIIDMAEGYIKFFDKNSPEKDEDLSGYHKMTEALDDIRGQSLKKMIPLTYKAMYEIEKK